MADFWGSSPPAPEIPKAGSPSNGTSPSTPPPPAPSQDTSPPPSSSSSSPPTVGNPAPQTTENPSPSAPPQTPSNQSAPYFGDEKGREETCRGIASTMPDGEGSEHNGQEYFPRVVWTPELHQKFVTAVLELGLEKAVPKKRHELMNVQGLKSIDKCRLYLRKKYNVQQHNMAYFQMSSSAFLSRSHLTKPCPSVYSSINHEGINSSSFIPQEPHHQNSSNSANPFRTYHRTLLPRVQNVNQASSPLEPLQFPRSKCMGDLEDQAIGGSLFNSCYQINDQFNTACKSPNISEVTKTDLSTRTCKIPIIIQPYYGGATRGRAFFFLLLLVAVIALSIFLWFLINF